jgi:hypothetical protein
MDYPKYKKLIFYLAIAIVVLLIAFGSIYYLVIFRKGIVLTPEQETKIQAEVSAIIKTNDFDKCKQIKNEIYRTACVNNIALNLAQEKQDISYCQKIDDKLMSIASCERRVLFKKSLDQERISVCNETANEEIREECKGRFWKLLAVKKEDIVLCQNTLQDDDRIICLDNYVFEKEFIGNENSFDCKKFNSEQSKSDCQAYKTKALSDELNDCYLFESDLFINYCFLKTR